MITPAYCRMMAEYNAAMNARLFDAASHLSDADRRAERGAFWGSLHGTLAHLLWADRMWMSRFANWPPPDAKLKQSAASAPAFDAMRAERAALDAALADWASRVDEPWLGGDVVWFSGAAGRNMRAARSALLVHLFNHQTHHRGQAHALLTEAGRDPGETDLFLVVDSSRYASGA